MATACDHLESPGADWQCISVLDAMIGAGYARGPPEVFMSAAKYGFCNLVRP